MGNGCHVTLVEGNVGVRIPSGSQSVGKDQNGIDRNRSSSTVVAKKSLVTRLSRVEHGAALGTPTHEKTANAAQIDCIPSESAGAPASLRALNLLDFQRT